MNRTHPRAALLAGLVAVILLGAACSDSDSDSADDTTTTAAGDAATDPGRVVALGEEFVLADLLELGIKPVASTATVVEAGFQGLDGVDVSGIQPLSGSEANLEQLAALDPDVIVAWQVVVDTVGRDKLEAMGEVIVIPENSGPAEQMLFLGEQFDREDEAEAAVAELTAARDEAEANAPADCAVSAATIYPGPTPAAWIGPPNAAAVALTEMGCELDPSTDGNEPDRAGRVYLSLESLGELGAPTMVLLQSDVVEGETEALAEIEADPIWQQLPAVAADRVHTLDRLGYPGVNGATRLFQDLAEALS